MADGLDFADALHLAKANACSACLTFNHEFAEAAKNWSSVPVTLP
jgi:predicted nucleic acid-binding protein